MVTRKKAAAPVVEHGIFTDELPRANVAKVQTEEDFFNEVRQANADRKAGRRTEPVTTISFDSVAALLKVLTPRRYDLIEAVKAQGRFNSIEALADAVHRDRTVVSKDIKALAEAGLLRVEEVINAGHGKRSEILPRAKTMRLELTL